jgi:hypothetical protein
VVWEGRSREAPPYPDPWRKADYPNLAPSELMPVNDGQCIALRGRQEKIKVHAIT